MAYLEDTYENLKGMYGNVVETYEENKSTLKVGGGTLLGAAVGGILGGAVVGGATWYTERDDTGGYDDPADEPAPEPQQPPQAPEGAQPSPEEIKKMLEAQQAGH